MSMFVKASYKIYMQFSQENQTTLTHSVHIYKKKGLISDSLCHIDVVHSKYKHSQELIVARKVK
jgi:hypothetical protein